MKQRLIGIIVFIVYRVLSWTWRLDRSEPPEFLAQLKDQKPFLMAHWHGDELALICLARRYRIATITSHSSDGTIMDTILKLLGALTSRGSSSKGGANALKNLIRIVKAKRRNCSFAVDGPKGPLHKVKPGVFELSRLMQMDIFAISVSTDRAWTFPKSWNKTFLPKPFARVNVVIIPALPAISKDQDPRSEILAHELEQKIAQTKASSAIF